MNDSRIHKKMKIAWDDNAVKLAVTNVAFHSKHRKGHQKKLEYAADVISEACFTGVTRDCDDELAAMDLSTIAVGLTLS